MMPTHAITDDTFQSDVLDSSTPVLVDFWAEWCPPCKALSPILEEVSNDMADTVRITKMNIEDSPKTPTTYGVRSIPTMILFKDGEIIAQTVGALSKPDLEKWLKDNT